jgi:hypothetical protein
MADDDDDAWQHAGLLVDNPPAQIGGALLCEHRTRKRDDRQNDNDGPAPFPSQQTCSFTSWFACIALAVTAQYNSGHSMH